MKRVVALLLVLVGFLVVTPAHAEPPLKPEAKRHRDLGVNFYNTADYGQAAEEFKAAYRIDPQPQLLYAIAQSERLNGDCAHAVDVYKAFLRTNPPANQAGVVQQDIGECERGEPPAAGGESQPPASRPASEVPAEHPASVPAATEHPATVPAVAPAAVGSAPEAPPAPSGPRAWYLDPLGLGLVAGGVVLVGAGVGMSVVGVNQQNAALDKSYTQAVSDYASGAHLRTLGAISAAVGAAAVVGGGVRLVLVRRSRERERLAFSVGPTAVALSGRF